MAVALPLLRSSISAESTDPPAGFTLDPEAPSQYTPPGLVRATASQGESRAPAAPTPGPRVQPAAAGRPEPAPVGAPRATNVQSLGNGRSSSRPPAALPVPATGPYKVVLAVDAGSPLQAVAQSLRQDLAGKGIDANVTTLAEAGRPDAVVALAAAPAAAVWYCDVVSSGSRDLAAALLAAFWASSGAIDAPAGFDCETAHGARARTPVTLVGLPAAAADAEATRLSAAIQGYLARYGTAARQARAAARMVWPATGAITSLYGLLHPLGIDIGQWEGNILAATDGTVFWAGGDPCCSYGRFVILDGPDGLRTLYGHFASLAVKTGDRVRQGQSLGVEGCTGVCTGPHLHFEVFDHGVRQDPLAYMP